MTGPIIDTVGLTPEYWVVVFEPKTSIWWGRFLTPGFGHCYMFGFIPDPGSDSGIWVFMEALVSGIFVGVAPPDTVERWFAQAYTGQLRLLKVRPQGNVVVRPRWAVTCAGAIGAVLGLKRLPLTPHGLFWRLRKLGAQEIGRNTDEIRPQRSSPGAETADGGGIAPAAGSGAGG